MTSVGSGALIGVAMIVIFRLTPQRVAGSSVFLAAMLLWVAGIAQVVSGNVDYGLVGNILIGSIPGVWIGAHFVDRVPDAGAARDAGRRAAGLGARDGQQRRRRCAGRRDLRRARSRWAWPACSRTCAPDAQRRRAAAVAGRQPPSSQGRPDRAGWTMSVAERPQLSHLRALESEAIHIMREVAAEFERPVLLFSGGKDSIVLLRLAEKAFRPAPFPFPLMHVDTGHNFPEVIEFRDRRVAELGERLIVASVQESIDTGRVVEETGPRASRNRLQTVTLLDAIAEHEFDAAFGGARRDEERARAKERVFSFRDDFGQWDPKNQRPELWNLYNGRIRKGENVRVFPLSNWTELDVWEYIDAERAGGALDLLRARARGLPARRDALRLARGTSS